MMVHTVLLALLLSLGCCGRNLDDEWISWKTKFNKNYNSEIEEAYRRSLWQKNVLEVMKHNRAAAAGHHSYSLGTNQFSDMTTEEVNVYLNCEMLKVAEYDKDRTKLMSHISEHSAPPSIDWSQKGFVSPVQDQGPCGSCWAFSAAGALEGQIAKKSNKSVVPLSVQNLVDCSWEDRNCGCNGGNVAKAFSYIIRKGIDSAQNYPYEANEGECRLPKHVAGRCTNYTILPPNETDLLWTVAQDGPVSVSVNAELQSFQFYIGGIYDDPQCNTGTLNHAVLVVGYGTDAGGRDYWKIKNSWGTTWGEQGYMRMERNVNRCGIANFAVLPKV